MEVVKNGKVNEKQRFKCKKCSFQFTRLTPRGRPAKDKVLAVTLYISGLSMNAIAKLLEVSTPTVLDAVVTRFEPIKKYSVFAPRQEMSLHFWHILSLCPASV